MMMEEEGEGEGEGHVMNVFADPMYLAQVELEQSVYQEPFG